MNMDWDWFLRLSLVSAIFTAVSNFLSTWFFNTRQRKQSAEFDGLRIAIALERYAYECAILISDLNNWHASDGTAGTYSDVMPSLKFDPSIDWKFLDLSLVDRLFRFENDILRAGSVIRGENDHLTHDDVAEEPVEQAGLLGFLSHILATDFRKKYSKTDIPEILHPWNYVDVLKRIHDKKVNEYRAQCH